MQESDQKALGAIQIMDCAWHFLIGLIFHKPLLIQQYQTFSF